MIESYQYTVVDEWPLSTGDRVQVSRTKWFEGPRAGEQHFSWRVRARNGQTIAGGGETYTRKSSAIRAALRSFPRVEADQ